MNFVILLTFLVMRVVATVDYPVRTFNTEFGHQERIINGKKAKPKEFPYQVSLLNLNKKSWCGGTLISNQWIVTAAACTVDKFLNASDIQVQLGVVNQTDLSEPGKKVFTIPKENVYNHEKFNPRNRSDDISLLKLPEPVQFDDYIQPVKLPDAEECFAFKIGIVSGWGRTSKDKEKYSDVLTWIALIIPPNALCRLFDQKLRETNICVDTSHLKAPCVDTGSPLVSTDPEPVLIGTSSYETRNCEFGYPAVFTRISSYLNWIKDKTGITNENK